MRAAPHLADCLEVKIVYVHRCSLKMATTLFARRTTTHPDRSAKGAARAAAASVALRPPPFNLYNVDIYRYVCYREITIFLL